MAKKYYIGLAVTFHDSAIAIVDKEGKILLAEATERYLQYKRAFNCEPDSLGRLKRLLKEYCPDGDEFVLSFNWLKSLSVFDKLNTLLGNTSPSAMSKAKRERRSVTFFPDYEISHSTALQRSSFVKRGVNMVKMIRKLYPESKISCQYFDHHLTHAALGCYASTYQEAACLIIDGFGQKGSTAIFAYQDGQLRRIRESKGAASLGAFYLMLTEVCGFDGQAGEEWKVMGLASYGEYDEEVYQVLAPMLQVKSGILKQSLPAMLTGAQKLAEIKQQRGDKIEEIAKIAYTGQYYFAEIMNQMLRQTHQLVPSENLVLVGGCALNSSYNGKIVVNSPFKNLFVPSAPADDGCALGAALYSRYLDTGKVRDQQEILSPYLGSQMSELTLENLSRFGKIPKMRHIPEKICQETAKLLAEGKLIGWVQGGAEFGPRALGNRSILADPRQPDMKDKINALVKFREEFRPFAPSILHEWGEEYFENYQESPYMERTLTFKPEVRDKVPAVVHADQTGRLQTVKKQWNPKYYQLIHEFYQLSNVPVILNTSFNIMGKPIIHTVEDALSVFYTTGLDALVLEDYLIEK